MTMFLPPEVRDPPRALAQTVPPELLRLLRTLLLRWMLLVDRVESGEARLGSPMLDSLGEELSRVERLLVQARGFPVARDLAVRREELQAEWVAEVMRLLAQGVL